MFSWRERLESVVDGSVVRDSAVPAEDWSLVPSVWTPGDMTASSGIHKHMPSSPDRSIHK